MKTKDITLSAFFIVLFVLSAKLVIPIGIIPITLQTCSMIIAGMLLTPMQILTSFGMYLLIGLCGLPVFASGGGIGYLLQPSFGFLLAFPIAAIACSFLRAHLLIQGFCKYFLISLIALFIVYAIGCLYMYLIFNFYIRVTKSIATILSIGAAPFIVTDTISAALGCLCALRLQQLPVLQAIHNHKNIT